MTGFSSNSGLPSILFYCTIAMAEHSRCQKSTTFPTLPSPPSPLSLCFQPSIRPPSELKEVDKVYRFDRSNASAINILFFVWSWLAEITYYKTETRDWIRHARMATTSRVRSVPAIWLVIRDKDFRAPKYIRLSNSFQMSSMWAIHVRLLIKICSHSPARSTAPPNFSKT